ncbi:primase-helicase family protein [candidate division KSB1 bacterium]
MKNKENHDLKKRTFKVSICSNYNSKQTKEYNNNKVANGWQLVERDWTEESVKSLSLNEGISGNEWNSGHRTKVNWIATHCIMLDFDEGELTLEKLLEDQKKWKFDSYIFSSQNHQRKKVTSSGKVKEPCDRLRVFIPLEEPIINNFDRKLVQNIFIDKYNGTLDKTFMDRDRYFAHGTDEVSSFISTNGFLNWRELIKENPIVHEVNTSGRKNKKAPTVHLFHLNDEILDEQGNTKIIRNLKTDERIFCPVCGEEEYRTNTTHNAVFKINPKGLPFIFCSSCKARGMGTGGKGVYNIHPDDGFKFKSEQNNATVFIDVINSRFYGGRVEKGTNRFMVRQLTTEKIVNNFILSNDLPIPRTFPMARYELNFSSNKIIDFENECVNKYIAPHVLVEPIPEGLKAKFHKYTEKVISHVFNYDKEIIDHFINDMAFLVQNRKKMITSYLLQGTEGTGKGLMFTNIFQKIFGEQYCTTTDQDAFGNQFNSFLTDNVFVLVDEVQADFGQKGNKNVSVIDKMKKAITDEFIQIEGKGKDRYNGNNNCSFLFATNTHHGVVISKDDRRFNVASRQETKMHNATWWPGYNDLKQQLENELQEFVWYLKQFSVDMKKIGLVLDNEPKKLLQALSTSNADEFFIAFKNGDISWLKNNFVLRNNTDQLRDEFASLQQLIWNFTDKNGMKWTDVRRLYNYINFKNLSAPSFNKIAKTWLPEPTTHKDEYNVSYHGIVVNWQENKTISEIG